MRSFWNDIPLLRITFLVIAGIVAELVCDFTPTLAQTVLWAMVALLGLSLLTLTGIGLVKRAESIYRLQPVNGLAIALLLVSSGYMLAWFNTDKHYQSHFQNLLQGQPVVIARVIKPPVEKEKTIAAVAEVIEVRSMGKTTRATGKILLYELRIANYNHLQYGDVVALRSKIDEFAGPKNPDEFDFKQYQAFHNIYHRTFLVPGNWHILARNQGNILMASVYRLRAYFLSVINRYVTDKNNFAVAAAIMLGYNDYITTDVSRAYTNSGTLHVLSVSGLHVGIMFFMLNFLLGWMDKRGRKGQVAKAVLIIGFIWFYACLTGLSPSVLRSALMFSMIQAGKTLTRHINMYNIIWGSVLLLIIFNPFLVTDIGFQLSYLAVFGIVFLYPKIYALIPIGSDKPRIYKRASGYLEKAALAIKYDWRWGFLYLLDFFWAMVAVSLAAQLATLPLSLYYFHQFPNLFLLSNLVVIPVSNLVLFLGTGLCAVGQLPYINAATGWCFNGLLTILNQFTFFIDAIPYSVIEGISITLTEMCLLYILLLLVCWLTEERRTKVLITCLAICTGLVSFNSLEAIKQQKQKSIIVYSVAKQRAISFISGTTAVNVFDDTLYTDQKKMKFNIKPYRWKHGIDTERPAEYKELSIGKLMLFEDKKILLVDTVPKHFNWQINNRLKAHLVILSHNPKFTISDLQKLCDFDEVVFDSSNRKKKTEAWKEECTKQKLKYWDVNTQGAYVADIRP